MKLNNARYLMLWVGEKGRSIFSIWKLTDDDQKKLEKYDKQFEAYMKPRSSIIYNRYKFQSKVQNPDESFEKFVKELQLLV